MLSKENSMAIMIPNSPHKFEPASQEGIMFEALRLLPDEYYVFHSFRITRIVDNTIYESETDFVVFNRKLGVLCIEAKSGKVNYKQGYWYYSNGVPMHNGGPFVQASTNKYKMIHFIEKSKYSVILNKCKFLHAVWFPSITEADLITMQLPSEADKNLVMTKEALVNPLDYINRIFSTRLPNGIETNLSETEEKRIIREVFCPQFNVFPAASFENDLKKVVFHRLLKEQSGILNYLSEQRSAVINGAAGTGKTMIAVEKSLRHAMLGEKVLFLCYNNQLKTYLFENYKHENIDFYTIAGLACKLCNTSVPDYNMFGSFLDDMYLSESFPYQHVVVDEGQDFGMDSIDETNLLEKMKLIIMDTTERGTFYVFYDKLQMIQSSHIPNYIEEAECKLTLYKNCRNTENIATTSLRPVTVKKPLLLEGCIKGAPANIYFCSSLDSIVAQMDRTIEGLKAEGLSDIIILTCKTETDSVLSSMCKNGTYKQKYRFTTCRKFKGLEADAVILIDVDDSSFNSNNALIFYVGSSRARLRLHIMTQLSDEKCTDILMNAFNYSGRIKKPKRELASALNAIGINVV